ncbi:MAG: LysR substrate-binding domain-containing protein [Pseudomonadota bacterium]
MDFESIDRADLRSLSVFERVAALQSFAKAGRQLGLPRSAVSRIIQQLEDQIGTALFRRTTRQVALTVEGEALRQRLSSPLAELRNALIEAAAPEGAPRGAVAFSVSPSFGRAFVLPALPSFARLFPDVRVDVTVSDGLSDLVADGLDFAIRVGALPDSSLIVRRLCEIDIVLAVPRALLGPGRPTQLSDLATLPSVGFRIPGTRVLYQWRVEEAEESALLAPEAPQIIVDSIEDVAALVRAGQGAAALPRYMVAEALAAGEVVEVLPQARIAPVPVHLCFPSSGQRPRRVEALVSHVTTHVKRKIAQLT